MNTKRILSFVLVLIFILSTGVITANAAQAYEYTDENGIKYIYAFYDDNGTTKAMIGDCKYSKDEGFTLTIPSELGGYPVAAIAEEVFYGHTKIAKVHFPESLEYIGDSAFGNCKLTSVHFPKNVAYIGEEAFVSIEHTITSYSVASANPYFKSVDGVVYTKDGKFLLMYPCNKQDKSFKIPEGVECVYNYAFISAENLTKVTLPESLMYINDHGFYGTGLEAVYLPENLQYIGYYAFAFCYNLAKISISENALPYIDSQAFNNTEWSRGVEYGDCSYIGHLLYQMAPSFSEERTVEIKEGTTAICPSAFENYRGSDIIKLPASLSLIHAETFVTADSIGRFEVSKDNPYFASIDGMLYSKDGKTLFVVPTIESEILTLPQCTEAIYSYAFGNRTREVNELVVPENVKVIYDSAFAKSDFKKITFLGNAVYAGEKLFEDCVDLEEIVLPANATMIGAEDLKGTWWYARRDGFMHTGTVMLGYEGDYHTSTLNLPAWTTAVGRKAFMSIKSVYTLVLPETLVAVGDFAFANCNKLKEVKIPASVDEIGVGAFGFSVTFDSETGEVTSYRKVEGFTIKGYTNSLAESYADANGFEFVSVGYLEPESTLLGDIDCDQRLTIKDATALQKYVAGMVGLNTQDKINADFNLDGKINVRDATAIQKKLAGLI